MVDQPPQLLGLAIELQAPILHQIQQQLAMVDDVKLQTVLPVVILQGCQAVGALHDHFFNPPLLKERHVFPGKLVKEILIPQPAERIAAALFILPQDTPTDTRLIQELPQRQGHLLGPGVKGAGAADVEQVLGLTRLKGPLTQQGGPLPPLRWGDPPGVTPPLHILEQV